MKKYLLLVVMCFVGMMGRQVVLAENIPTNNDDVTINIEGTTVTITCTKAGALSEVNLNAGNPSLGSRIADCSTVKFDGYFCESDLNHLKGNNNQHNYCQQSTVDMSEAHFVYYGGDANDHTNNYAAMKFENWGATVETAITSKYADNNISNEIFKDCKSLTSVNFMAGTVKGFNDHKTSDGYASGLSLTIGKDVTSIADNAFIRCDALTTVTFDKDYSGGETPKNLTIGENAFESCVNLTGIEFPNRVSSIGNSAFKKAGTEVSEFCVSFERRAVSNGASVDYDVDLAIGSSAFSYCTTIRTLTLPIRLKSLGNNAFEYTTSLEDFSVREEENELSRLQTIPSGAFRASKLSEVIIPRSVTLIEGEAFQQCANLTTVRFQGKSGDPNLLVKSSAFGNCENISDVYVDVKFSDRKIICEYDAFDRKAAVGQTDVTSNRATLHFPESEFDYYAGNWKKGMTFTQENLLHIYEGLTSDELQEGQERKPGDVNTYSSISQTTGKYEPATEGNIYVPGNGWQQFATTSTNIDIIIPPGEFIRTYSTSTAYDLPEHVRIFRVINFTDGYQSGMDANNQELADAAEKIAITREITDYIPKNTGLIMVGTVSSAVLYYFKMNSGTTTYPHTGHDVSDPNKANLLEPTLDNDQFPLAPVWRDADNNIDYRNFGMLKTDHKFGRAKVTTMRKNYAYLKVPAELFHWRNESINGSSNYAEETTNSPAKISVLYIYDDFNVDNNGIATAIKKAIDKEMNNSNSYYTLQGVKVASPTSKGIYVVNGKKVIIK